MNPEQSLRRAYETFNERGLAAVAEELWHPEIEYREAADFPGAGTYRGREAVTARFAEYLEALGVGRADLQEVAARGDDVAWTVRFTGRSSAGVPHSHTWGYVGRFEEGLLIDCQADYEAREAIRALEAEG